ncbi:WXG100-like domain-containing protein [Saccharothrix variisporea]|uniref:Papain fold toxin 1 (Glutamine deamidase) of polymorphic toxin system n=1 Tax=Saccharothrix variisporea TaxID=543527 RepID=A0A495X6Q3_9PSEU|nr:toxin glutamine deamidase domain-containing protein [Saccharothrix variisporea]RKT67178.1 papain fold toxin 1 (glutamine deamidase) of polymorphic toxin system [Saccharothrix variisporea]
MGMPVPRLPFSDAGPRLVGLAGDLFNRVCALIGGDQAYPPDEPEDIRDLGRAWRAAADRLDEAVRSGVRITGAVFDAWPDAAGFEFKSSSSKFHTGSYSTGEGGIDALVAEMRKIADACEHYAEEVYKQRLATKIEMLINVAAFALAFTGTGAIAGLFVRKLASNVLKRITLSALNLGARTRTAAAGRVALDLAVELGKEAGEELAISAGTQLGSMAAGYNHDGFDTKRVLTDTGAGALGGALGFVPGKAISKLPVRGALGQHLVAGLTGAGLNAVTSPVASLAAQNIADGEFGKLGDLGAYGQAIKDNGLSAARMGAFRANGSLAASQVGQAVGAQPNLSGAPSPGSSGDPGGPPSGPPPGGDPTPRQAGSPASATGSGTGAGAVVESGTVGGQQGEAGAERVSGPVSGRSVAPMGPAGESTGGRGGGAESTVDGHVGREGGGKDESATKSGSQSVSQSAAEVVQGRSSESESVEAERSAEVAAESEVVTGSEVVAGSDSAAVAEVSRESSAESLSESSPEVVAVWDRVPGEVQAVWGELPSDARQAVVALAGANANPNAILHRLRNIAASVVPGDPGRSLGEIVAEMGEAESRAFGEKLARTVSRKSEPAREKGATPEELAEVGANPGKGMLAEAEDIALLLDRLEALENHDVDVSAARKTLADYLGNARNVQEGRGNVKRSQLDGDSTNVLGLLAQVDAAVALAELHPVLLEQLGLAGLEITGLSERVPGATKAGTDIDIHGVLGDGTEVWFECKDLRWFGADRETYEDVTKQIKSQRALAGPDAKIVALYTNELAQEVADGLIASGADAVLHYHGFSLFTIIAERAAGDPAQSTNPTPAADPTRAADPAQAADPARAADRAPGREAGAVVESAPASEPVPAEGVVRAAEGSFARRLAAVWEGLAGEVREAWATLPRAVQFAVPALVGVVGDKAVATVLRGIAAGVVAGASGRSLGEIVAAMSEAQGRVFGERVAWVVGSRRVPVEVLFPWLGAVNPQFHVEQAFNGYRVNCRQAAVLTDRYLAGRFDRDPAPPTAEAVAPDDLRTGWRQRLAADIGRPGGGFEQVASVEDVAERLRQLGSGARAIVHGMRSWQGNPVPGHLFNAVNVDGEVRFLDGQSGTAADLDGFDEGFELLITEDNAIRAKADPSADDPSAADPEPVPPRGRVEDEPVVGLRASDAMPQRPDADWVGVHAAAHAAMARVDLEAGMRAVEKPPGAEYLLTGPLGNEFTATVRAGELPGDRVAEYTVNRARGTVEVVVSERASYDAIPIAVAHAVAAAAAELSGTPRDTTDFLHRDTVATPEPTGTPRAADDTAGDPTLSPADHGRAARLLAHAAALDGPTLPFHRRPLRRSLRALIEEMGLDPRQEGAERRLDALPSERMREVVRRFAPPPSDIPGRVTYVAYRAVAGSLGAGGFSLVMALSSWQIAVVITMAALARSVGYGLADPGLAVRENNSTAAARKPVETRLAAEADARRDEQFGPLLQRWADLSEALRTGTPVKPRRPPAPVEVAHQEDEPVKHVGWKPYAVRYVSGALAGTAALGATSPLVEPIATLGLLVLNWTPALVMPSVQAVVNSFKQDDKVARGTVRLERGAREVADHEQEIADLVGTLLDLAEQAAARRSDTGASAPAGTAPFVLRDAGEGSAQVVSRLVPRGEADVADPTRLAEVLTAAQEYLVMAVMRNVVAALAGGVLGGRVHLLDQDAKEARRVHDQSVKEARLHDLRREVVQAILRHRAAQEVLDGLADPEVVADLLRPITVAPRADADRPSGRSSRWTMAGGLVTGGAGLGITAVVAAVLGIPGVVGRYAGSAAGEAVAPLVDRLFKGAELDAEDAAATVADARKNATAEARARAVEQFVVRVLEDVTPPDAGPWWKPAGLLDRLQNLLKPPPPLPSDAGVSAREAHAAYERALAEPGRASSLPGRLAELVEVIDAANRVDRMAAWVGRTGQTRSEIAARNELIAAIHRYNALSPDRPLAVAHLLDGVHQATASPSRLAKVLPHLGTAVSAADHSQVRAVLTERHLSSGRAEPLTPPRTLARLTEREGWADRVAAAVGRPGATFQPVATTNDVVARLRELGKGARAIVHGTRSGDSGGAHVFNAVNIDGEVYFLDGDTLVDLTRYPSGVAVLVTHDNGEAARHDPKRTTTAKLGVIPARVAATARDRLGRLHDEAHVPARIAEIINPYPRPRTDTWSDVRYTEPWWRE